MRKWILCALLSIAACGRTRPVPTPPFASAAQLPDHVCVDLPPLPPDAESVRIHWRLKLPPLSTLGEFVLRNDDAFRSFLAGGGKDRQGELHARWNALDFRKQMALVATGPCHTRIDGVWRTPTELICVVSTIHGDEAGVEASGVAVNRTDLPVRFVRCCCLG